MGENREKTDDFAHYNGNLSKTINDALSVKCGKGIS